jgi:hypothetical protein
VGGAQSFRCGAAAQAREMLAEYAELELRAAAAQEALLDALEEAS